MNKFLYGFIVGFFLLSLVFSCQKEEGLGGTNTLKGKLWVKNYSSTGVYLGEYVGFDERVYLICGSDSFYCNDLRSNYDGGFEFQNLYKGTYSVFAYSKCDTCTSPEVPVFGTVTFDKNRQTLDVGQLTLRK